MTMEEYLKEIEFAATPILPAIWHEHAELKKMQTEVADLARRVEAEYRAAQSIADDAMDADDVMLATARHWENYFGDDKTLYHKDKETTALQQRVAAREFAVAALAGNLLQFAKQGISIAHGNLGACPSGRNIGTQVLKTVIWQGRNQALHWEGDGHGQPLHRPVEDCFNRLIADFGSRFTDFKTKNLGFAVVELLGWKSFVEFKADMLSMK